MTDEERANKILRDLNEAHSLGYDFPCMSCLIAMKEAFASIRRDQIEKDSDICSDHGLVTYIGQHPLQAKIDAAAHCRDHILAQLEEKK